MRKVFQLSLISILFFVISMSTLAQEPPVKPATNIADALKYERTENSMPGKFPGKVVQINHTKCVIDNRIVYDAAYDMIAKGMLELTNQKILMKHG